MEYQWCSKTKFLLENSYSHKKQVFSSSHYTLCKLSIRDDLKVFSVLEKANTFYKKL
jgi:hypothetical protein